MPQRQLHQPQNLLGYGFVFQALEGMYEEDEKGDPLVHLQAGQLQSEQLLEEDWDQLWVGVESIPGWHIFPKLLVQHDCHGQNVLMTCLLQVRIISLCSIKFLCKMLQICRAARLAIIQPIPHEMTSEGVSSNAGSMSFVRLHVCVLG